MTTPMTPSSAPTHANRLLLAGLLAVCGLAAAFTIATPQGTTQPTAGQPNSAQPNSAQPSSIQPVAPLRRATDARGNTIKLESLPIKRITLYRSGVGSFERRGVIDGDASVQLRFNTDQVNDILKSMVVLDLGGGQVDSVSYGSKEPLAKRLASFGVDISDNPSVKELLSQLRGSKATISTPEGQVSGTILGTESRPEAQGQANNPIEIPYLNLLTSAGIRSINYRSITNVVLDDKALNDELGRALAALAEHRADRTKTVDVGFSGQGSRDVAIAYVNEMPVWKTSYRLVLPDSRKGAKEGDSAKDQGSPTIQGWAIVENTTDEDWNDVTLSLVSGRPVSFQMDLYEPLFVERPEIPVPTIPGVAPRIYTASTAMRNSLQEMADAELSSRKSMDRRAPGAPPASSAPANKAEYAAKRSDGGGGESPFRDAHEAAGEPAIVSAQMANYAARAQAQAVESGELFQYQLDHPVTVERQRSAMLPILSSAIDGRRISIYNRADGSQYPMRGIELKNTSKLQLMPGPISVYDGGAYAGDAQIGHVPPGDKRLLAYSVDLDVNVVAKDDSTSTIQKIRITKGALEQTVKRIISTAYAFKNKDQARDRTIIVEHPRMEGWTLVDESGSAKPVERADNIYRFELAIAPDKEGTLRVAQEQVMRHTAGVFDFDWNWLVQQQQGGRMSEAALKAIQEAGRRRGLVEDANRRIAAFEKTKTEIDQDQARLRQNLTSIDKTSQLYSRYMTKLSDQETRLDKLLEDLEKARADAQKLQAELDEYVSSLNVE
ncbi:MAG: hypothetical protein IT435_17020 [Phycisphaerales bacterium]|nr:hypothetical protein [Phycisphaerales bacterium]